MQQFGGLSYNQMFLSKPKEHERGGEPQQTLGQEEQERGGAHASHKCEVLLVCEQVHRFIPLFSVRCGFGVIRHRSRSPADPGGAAGER